jgi:hypothetical protein
MAKDESTASQKAADAEKAHEGWTVGGGDRVRADGVKVKGNDPNNPKGWTPRRS